MNNDVRPAKPAIIGVQTLLFRTPPEAIQKTLLALNNAAQIGKSEGMCSGFVVVLGDGSPNRTFAEDQLDALRAQLTHIDELHYAYFDANVGTSRGHNEMAKWLPTADYLIFSNPDVIPEPRAIWRMLEAFNDPTVGMVEAKQLPVEHPKDFDSGTGETSWATTAFAMTPRPLFFELEGFDAASFFMYCDDVDYSWRVREAGSKVIFQSAAVVYHDKSLTLQGGWVSTGAERRYSAQAALFLAHKWSQDAEVERLLQIFSASEDSDAQEAAKVFRRQAKNGALVPQRDARHKIATFTKQKFGNIDVTFYAKHRFLL